MLAHNRCLIVLALISGAAANRVEAHVNRDVVQNAATGKKGGPWELTYKGLSCYALEPVPFVGMKTHWPKCWQQAMDKARDLAEKGNCKLCDVTFSGSKPEAEQSMMSTGCSATVTCAGARLGTKACFEGHGKLTAVVGLNDAEDKRMRSPEMACLPCPAGCKKCGVVESKITGVYRKFKCISAPILMETDGFKGERCQNPMDHECGECKHRTCGGFGPNFGCDKKDFKSDCKFPATFANTPEPQAAPEDYELSVKAGKNKNELPPAFDYLSGKI